MPFRNSTQMPLSKAKFKARAAAYLQVSVSRSISDYLPCGTGSVVEDTRTLQLWKVQTDGTASMQVLKTYSGGTADAAPGEVIPDGSGGALAAMDSLEADEKRASARHA